MDTISSHEQRIMKTANSAKIKMPYKMFIGMRKKTIEKLQKRETANKELDILAESGGFRKQRLMEKVFAQREENKRKEKQEAKVERKIKFEKIMRREREKKNELIHTIKKEQHKENLIKKFH